MNSICTTGKIRYSSKRTAMKAKKRLNRKGEGQKNWRKMEQEYECSRCGGWHLSSWTEKYSERIDRKHENKNRTREEAKPTEKLVENRMRYLINKQKGWK